MSTKPSTGRVRSAYEFIKAHRNQYSARTMCRVLGVAPSGYYAWLQQPVSTPRAVRIVRATSAATDSHSEGRSTLR